MKKTFKGFTLVECLIAMAILAIAGTLMAEIYAAVTTRNNYNHFMNSSLANQMAYIEKYTNAEAVPIYFGGLDGPAGSKKPKKDDKLNGASATREAPHTYIAANNNKGTTAYAQVQKLDSSGNVVSTDKYSFPVDIYVMYSRDTQNDASGKAKGKTGEAGEYEREDNGFYNAAKLKFSAEDNSNLRYKYILGHTT